MSEIKLSLLDKRLAQFAESTTDLLTDIHARNKSASSRGEKKGTLKKERKMRKKIIIPNPDIDILDEERSGL